MRLFLFLYFLFFSNYFAFEYPLEWKYSHSPFARFNFKNNFKLVSWQHNRNGRAYLRISLKNEGQVSLERNFILLVDLSDSILQSDFFPELNSQLEYFLSFFPDNTGSRIAFFNDSFSLHTLSLAARKGVFEAFSLLKEKGGKADFRPVLEAAMQWKELNIEDSFPLIIVTDAALSDGEADPLWYKDFGRKYREDGSEIYLYQFPQSSQGTFHEILKSSLFATEMRLNREALMEMVQEKTKSREFEMRLLFDGSCSGQCIRGFMCSDNGRRLKKSGLLSSGAIVWDIPVELDFPCSVSGILRDFSESEGETFEIQLR